MYLESTEKKFTGSMYIEKIDDLEICIDKCFPITNDAILLAEYVLKDNVEKGLMCEIGTGSGYISIKLRNVFNRITAVDINAGAIENLEKNLKKQKIENIEVKNIDILNLDDKFDTIVSNPPFFKLNEGKLPFDKIRLISKFEYCLDMEKLLNKTYELLKKSGTFYYIYPLTRCSEFEKIAENIGLKIENISKIDKRVIIKGKKI